MTVRDLIEYLQAQPQNARVFEDSGGELREVNPEDISTDSCAEGNPIDSNEYQDDEWEELQATPIVILGAWS